MHARIVSQCGRDLHTINAMAAVTLTNGDTIPQNGFHVHNGMANGDAITHNGVYTNVTNGVHNGVANGTVYTNGDAITANGVESSSSEEEEEVVHVCPLTRKMLKQISQKTFQLDELDGVSLPPDNKLRELQSEFTPRAGDVFVVTYPKCGTIWTQHIVKLIRNNGVDNGMDNDTAFPWVELTAPGTVSVSEL